MLWRRICRCDSICIEPCCNLMTQKRLGLEHNLTKAGWLQGYDDGVSINCCLYSNRHNGFKTIFVCSKLKK